MRGIFYGWYMVAACLVVAIVGWSLGLFGSSVFLHAVTETKGWSIAVVSSAITLFYLVGAATAMPVGSLTARHGPRPVIASGALIMAAGVAGLGQVGEPWHVHVAFAVMGVGWSCLSMTAITTTLAPWFEKHQGRAVSSALMGASLGGMLGAPLLIYAIQWLGFSGATLAAAAAALVIVLPLAAFVLRHRPQDMGLLPDGELPGAGAVPPPSRRWTRAQALRTAALLSVIFTFGAGLLVQIGFLTHHVALVAPALGDAGAAATIAGTALTALLGRMVLARFADRIDVRLTAGGVLLLGAASLGALALVPVPAVLIGASVMFGITVGNVTTLGPIIVRREFGALSYGAVYGLAATAIQLISAFGPTLFGVLRDSFGSYAAPLLLAAVIDVLCAIAVVLGGRRGLPLPQAAAGASGGGARTAHH